MLFGNKTDINAGIKEFESTPNALLYDVRETDEYAAGHIPGSVNMPLSTLAEAKLPEDKNVPLYVHCLSGARSSKAVKYLQMQGYTNVKNIGGINAYKGKIEK
ncbi:MAG: rhodanese-like domain-containing protein [Eubacterium sp.]|nr:rhodanese-like domain-containing protein [Eubacterium sp.]